MAVEVVGFEIAQAPIENGTDLNAKQIEYQGSEPIKFGSHGDQVVKAEGDIVSNNNLPKDAVDEWPAPKQIHSFYFVKSRSYEDPKIKAKTDYAEKEIQKRGQGRFQLIETIKAKRSDRAEVNAQLQSLFAEDKQFRAVIDGKRKEMEPLQQALGKLRNTNTAGRGGICSSEEELNDLIRSLHYHMQHESIPLSEEKQLLKEIKQLEGTREKVIANSAVRTKIQDSMGQKDAIKDQVKLIGGNLDEIRKEHLSLRAKIKRLEEERKAIEDDLSSLQAQLDVVSQKKAEAHETVQELRKQRDEGNGYHYQSRATLNKARELAAKKDINALEEFSNAELDNFMSLWCNDKDFRDDYEKRILPSLDFRQLSRDGRMRNPGEKPLVVVEAPTPSKTEVLEKPNVKQPKEDAKSSIRQDTANNQNQNVHKEAIKKKSADLDTTVKHDDVSHEEVLEKLQKDVPPVKKEVDTEKLKEMKRAEEIVKAKLAAERKKKLAEKTAAKAAIRAQKEAEKKMKEREKKAKKKASPSITTPEEAVEVVEVPAESESLNVEAPVPTKEKIQKENTIRYKSRSKGLDSRPKIMVKRKKSTNYWVWAAPVGIAIVLMFLAIGYRYFV